MPTIALPLPSSFSLPETVVSHGWYVLPPFRWDGSSETLERTELLHGRAVDLTIRAGNRLTVSSKTALARHREMLSARVNRMLQLHVDLDPFHAQCRRRRSHRMVAERGFGRLLCGSTLFEDAVKIILTTNTTWSQTVRMTTLLVDHLGVATPSGHKAFPTSEQVASSSESALRETCRLGYRAPYVLGLARGIVDGSLDLDEIADQSQPTEELFRSYRKLPGIGPYGAAHLLAMDGRHDYIAVDTEFRSFVRRVHFKGREVSDEEMLEVYRGWGRWKYLGYWSELWMDISRRVDERPQ